MKKIVNFLLIVSLLLVPAISSAQTSEIEELRNEVKKMRVLLEDLALRIEKLGGTVPKPIPPKPIPCRIFEKDLSVGKTDASTGGEVSELQVFLKESGEYSYPQITGYFGSVTEKALKSWQQKNGLAPVGLVNSETKEIFRRPCAPLPTSSFSASPMAGEAPLKVKFQAFAEAGVSPSLYYVDFGDGESSPLEVFSKETCKQGSTKPCIARTTMVTDHTYEKPGTYVVHLNKKYVCPEGQTTCITLESTSVANLKILVK